MAGALRGLRAQSGIAQPRICVAFSGGLDSTVLLHQLAQLRQLVPVRALSPFALSALHVNHGLSPNAGAWARHCRAICRQLDVPIRVRRVTVSRAARTSLEEEARKARYAAFAAAKADVMALAQHADDQAETVLLQLLRGAGVKGLAGMPVLKPLSTNGFKPILVWRPVLDHTRAWLLAYAHTHQLVWIEDESNADNRFRRNYLRNRIMPLVEAEFPAAATTLARAARHLADAADLLDVLADEDLAQVRAQANAKTGANTNATKSANKNAGDGLSADALKRLPDARLRNALRRWLDQAGVRQPPEARLNALVKALGDSTNDTRLTWQHEGVTLRRNRGILVFEMEASPGGKYGGKPGGKQVTK